MRPAPGHVRARLGAPWAALTAGRLAAGEARLIQGGGLTGRTLADPQTGVHYDDRALTALPEDRRRRFLGFLAPAAAEDTVSGLCLSALRPAAPRTAGTAMHGEKRACLTCGWCADICPAGVLPQLLNRYAEAGLIDEAEGMGLDLCVDCGLCSYVCPSKIEILAALKRVKARLQREKSA